MTSFEDMLREGGRSNSLGRTEEVMACVREDPARLDELFGCIGADDAWVRMRAVDGFEKLVRERPERAQPYVERMLAELLDSEQPSIQWHLAQLFTTVELTAAQRGVAVGWLCRRIATTDVDWIVSVNAMRALLHLRSAAGLTPDELDRLFAVQEDHHAASVQRKARGFREDLTREGG